MDSSIFTQISQLGFPIVISLYLLTRIEAKMEVLTSSINELNKSIALLSHIEKEV